MVVIITTEEHIHFFSSKSEPAVSVDPGARLRIQTTNSVIERMKADPTISVEDMWRPIPQEESNPATGPIYVNGSNAGDVLAVKILSVQPIETGFSAVGPGALGGQIEGRLMRFFDNNQEELEFVPGITVPKRPMVGVIGTAPAEGSVSTQVPGDHGGNMDASVIAPGATVYLPVAVPGALLSVGDVHAAMGDGEVNGQALETQAWVDIEVNVLPGVGLKRPMVETDSNWITIGSNVDLEKAVWSAVQDMASFLAKHLAIELSEAFLLAGLAGEARICQVVNRLRTARVEFPKACIKDKKEITLWA